MVFRYQLCISCSVIDSTNQLLLFQYLIDNPSSLLDCIGRSFRFSPRDAMYTVLAMGLCLCLSQVGVILKWLSIGSHKQNHTVAQGV